MKKAAVMKAAMKKAAMKSAMKAAMKKSAMKGGMKKATKAKRISVIAKGKAAKAAVFAGRKEKTVGGLTKAALTKSRTGKVVSKQASARAKNAYATSSIKRWAEACKAARKALGLKGFVPMGGKTAA